MASAPVLVGIFRKVGLHPVEQTLHCDSDKQFEGRNIFAAEETRTRNVCGFETLDRSGRLSVFTFAHKQYTTGIFRQDFPAGIRLTEAANNMTVDRKENPLDLVLV